MQVKKRLSQLTRSRFQGSKGINTANLYRAKFFDGSGNLHNAQFGKGVWRKRDEDYADMWKLIEEVLSRNDEYKYFDLVKALLNDNAIECLVKNGELPATRKRPRAALSSEEEEIRPTKYARIAVSSNDGDTLEDQTVLRALSNDNPHEGPHQNTTAYY
jgi:hypothetical protein